MKTLSLCAVAFLLACASSVNLVPVVQDDTVSGEEDVELRIPIATLLANDSDDGLVSPLIVSGVFAEAHGEPVLQGEDIVFRPEPNYHGPASFRYLVSDGDLSAEGTVTVSLAPANDAPVAVADDNIATSQQDTSFLFAASLLLTNDTDPDGDVLSVVAVSEAVSGSVSLQGENILFVPTAGVVGTASFVYTISDGFAESSATATLQVLENPEAPIARSDAFSTAEDLILTIPTSTLLANDSTATGSAPTLTTVSNAVNGNVEISGQSVVFVPTPNFHGSASFDYTISDGSLSGLGTVSITVTPVNDAPVATGQNVTTPEDTAKIITLAGSDIDGDGLLFFVLSLPSHGVLSGTAPNLIYTPNANFTGLDAFTVVASDSALNSTPATVTIAISPVNDAPVAQGDVNGTNEDVVLTLSAASLLLNDSDVDTGTTLSLTAVSNALNGTAVLSGQNVVFTPTANFSGTASFDYTLSDGLLSDVATVSITVVPVNDAPVANNQSLTIAEGVSTNISLSFSDIDSPNTSVNVVTFPQHGTLLPVSSGVFSYTPDALFSGADSFSYQVSDGLLSSNLATVSITVTSVNNAPTANSQSVSTAEDTAKSITLTGADPDGDTLSFQVISSPSHGSLSPGAGSTLLYTPNANFNGSDVFTFVASDGSLSSSTATVSITVTPVNDAPVAQDDVRSTNEDVVLTLSAASLLLNDSDVDTGTTLSLTAVSNAVNGTAVLSGQNVVFTPAANFSGTASFDYTLSDGLLSDIGTVSITVVPVNDAPVATAQSVTTAEDTAKAIVLSGVDIDGDPLSFTVLTNPTNGVLSGLAPSLLYTPNANFSGSDSFTFQASDGGLSTTATVGITVTAVNDAPVAVNDDLRVSAGGSIFFAGENRAVPFSTILSNDSDVDNAAGQLFVVDADSIMAAVTLASTEVSITPSAGFSGVGSVTYTISDGIAFGSADILFDVVIPVCGDALVNSATEQCDDGNTTAGDGCGATCQRECGNGVLDGTEACDDGNNVDTDSCRNTCQAPNIIQVVTGSEHSCMLSDAGAVRCWGKGLEGQLGYGNTLNIGDNETPASVGNVNVGGFATQLAAGNTHTCALLSDGNVRCWGLGTNGRLGYGNSTTIGDNETPASVGNVNVGGIVTQLAAGKAHTCAVLNTGSVRCWGLGTSGQLGYGNTTSIGDNEAPASVNPVNVGGTVTQIAAGDAHTCAVLSDGNVRCWGQGSNGELGYGNTTFIGDTEAPAAAGNVNVGGTVTQIAAGFGHTCALLSTGSIRCWGRGLNGQLGYANASNIGDNETPVIAGDVNVGGTAIQVSAHGAYTCAVLVGGSVRCWGRAAEGQLGYGNVNTIGDTETPASVGSINVGSTVAQIAAGVSHTCALLGDGNLRCWGAGSSGQLGYGDVVFAVGDDEVPSVFSPVVFSETITQIVNGTKHSCALFNTGTVRCWGFGGDGQLGYANTNSIGDDDNIAQLPTVNIGGTVTQLAAGDKHTCALLSTGNVRCWGAGISGRLGYANITTIGDNETPASAGNVNVGATVTQIVAGFDYTCALLTGGSVRCWGNGGTGSLGYGNANNIGDNETPASAGNVNVGGTVTQLAASFHTCALLSGGSVRCWGNGANGALGYADIASIGDNETPASAGNVNVGGTVTQVVVGFDHTCALLSGGSVRCWGDASIGQLGYANTNNIGDNEAPSAAGNVNVGDTVTKLAAGWMHTCAILSTGSVRCWGEGASGKLGYGNTSNIGDNETPTSAGNVNVGGTVTQLTASFEHTCAMLGGGSMKCWGNNADGRLGYGNLNILFGDDEVPADLGIVSIFE